MTKQKKLKRPVKKPQAAVKRKAKSGQKEPVLLDRTSRAGRGRYISGSGSLAPEANGFPTSTDLLSELCEL